MYSYIPYFGVYTIILTKHNIIVELTYVFLMENRKLSVNQMYSGLCVHNVLQGVYPRLLNYVHIKYPASQDALYT